MSRQSVAERRKIDRVASQDRQAYHARFGKRDLITIFGSEIQKPQRATICAAMLIAYRHTYHTLHFITVHYVSLHFITFHYVSLRFITFHCVNLH